MLTRRAGYVYDPDYIEKVAVNCPAREESPLRFFYYDCAPFVGRRKLPVSGDIREFGGSDTWLKALAAKNLFAVRRGVLKFRGFKPKHVPIVPRELTDDDFAPDFEQKGVDMRIGLDIATFCQTRAVERIILVTGDTDCIPAMKFARIGGLQIVLITFPGQHVAPELLWHTDFRREIPWPPGERLPRE